MLSLRRMSTPARLAALLVGWIVVSATPVAAWLESSMLLHVLVQLPLLAWAGWLGGALLPSPWVEWLNRYNRRGVTGVVLVSGVAFFWMLPSALDASLDSGFFAAAKAVSITLLIGTALFVTSRVWHPLLKGLFLLEAWAMLARLGYVYAISPDRLCTNYLFGEQQLLGEALLWLAGAWAVLWTTRIMTGPNWPRLKTTGN